MSLMDSIIKFDSSFDIYTRLFLTNGDETQDNLFFWKLFISEKCWKKRLYHANLF